MARVESGARYKGGGRSERAKKNERQTNFCRKEETQTHRSNNEAPAPSPPAQHNRLFFISGNPLLRGAGWLLAGWATPATPEGERKTGDYHERSAISRHKKKEEAGGKLCTFPRPIFSIGHHEDETGEREGEREKRVAFSKFEA